MAKVAVVALFAVYRIVVRLNIASIVSLRLRSISVLICDAFGWCKGPAKPPKLVDLCLLLVVDLIFYCCDEAFVVLLRFVTIAKLAALLVAHMPEVLFVLGCC